MKALVERIKQEGEHVGGGIVKVDGFLNHQVDAELTYAMGEELVRRFGEQGVSGITKIVSAEVSGIPVALAVARILGVPMIYARKHRSSVMTDVYYFAQAHSRTKDEQTHLMISKKYLKPEDRVIVIDDFLATGSTVTALGTLIVESGATMCAIGCVIEKPQEGGREKLASFGVPIEALSKVELIGDELKVS
ncbi:MAG: xanthine phosphoribosyltransferase [Gammaproteobacteria bacterium]|nr:xanthine phosphoribosyltransferase [Gammaproteobacteria bacterium]